MPTPLRPAERPATVTRPASPSGAEPVLPTVVTVDEFARHFRWGRRQVYEAIAAGQIPTVRLAGRIRIPVEAALRRLMEGD